MSKTPKINELENGFAYLHIQIKDAVTCFEYSNEIFRIVSSGKYYTEFQYFFQYCQISMLFYSISLLMKIFDKGKNSTEMFCLKWILDLSKDKKIGQEHEAIARYLQIVEVNNSEKLVEYSAAEIKLNRDIEALRNIRNLSFFHNNKGVVTGSYQPTQKHEISELKKSFQELVEFASKILNLCTSVLLSSTNYAELEYSNYQDWVENIDPLFKEVNHGVFQHIDTDQRPAGLVKYEIAQNLLAKGFDIRDVERWTGMPESRIKLFREHLNGKCPVEN